MATYANFQIQNYTDMVNWVKMKLGYPLIQVEMTDDQIKSCIDDATEVYSEYVTYDEDYLGINLDNYVEGEGITLPDDVLGIFSLDDEGVAGSVNHLFSVPNQMLSAGMLPIGGSAGSGASWVDYEIALQGLKTTRMMLGGGYRWNFNERTKNLTLLPDPAKSSTEDASIVCGVYIARPEDQMYGERLCKRLALAYTKQILGKVRGTFQNVPLLAGSNINEGIGEEGKEEEEALMEELKNMMPSAFMVG